MRRQKAAKRAKKVSRKTTRARVPVAKALELLALELYGVVRAALAKYGLSAREQRGLFDRAQRIVNVEEASASHLNEIRPLGDLMTTWLEELPYVDAAGKPKVLLIEGRGATFESLAKKFLPAKPLKEVVALACRMANVGTLPGGRIALYGDTMVSLVKNRESALAQTVLHIRQIMDTCFHNVQRAEEVTTPGRTERIVTHVISAAEFERFQRVIRPQLHDLCERVDRLLKSGAERTPRNTKARGAAGIGIYVYYDGSMKHVRDDRSDALE